MTSRIVWPDCPLCQGKEKAHFYLVPGIGIYACFCQVYGRKLDHGYPTFECLICSLVDHASNTSSGPDIPTEETVAHLRIDNALPPKDFVVEDGMIAT